jgi:hypothetical protein
MNGQACMNVFFKRDVMNGREEVMLVTRTTEAQLQATEQEHLMKRMF